jgi:predicted GIY-YIG superfamily endonuclease
MNTCIQSNLALTTFLFSFFFNFTRTNHQASKGTKLKVLGHLLGQIRVSNHDVNNGRGYGNNRKSKIVAMKPKCISKNRDWKHETKAKNITSKNKQKLCNRYKKKMKSFTYTLLPQIARRHQQ